MMKNVREDIDSTISVDPVQKLFKRILVADDNEAIQDIVSRFFESIGFEVKLACNEIEALNKFITEYFDLVFTDMNMPIMNGWELARFITKKSPKTPVILMTGENREAISLEMCKVNIDHVIFKPFSLDNLHKTLQKFIVLN
jgi:two-component system, NarL family, capsular synthesis sensor histidine kinase RcsC